MERIVGAVKPLLIRHFPHLENLNDYCDYCKVEKLLREYEAERSKG